MVEHLRYSVVVLNTIKIFTEAIRLISNQWQVFVSVLAIPIIAYCLLGMVDDVSDNRLLSLAITLLGLVLHVVIAVSTHRLVLLGPDSVSKWALFQWGVRESWFFFYAMGLELLPLLGAVIPSILWFPVILGLFYLMARLSLVFPSIALEQSSSLQRAWRLSENHSWDMLLIFVIYPILIVLPIAMIFIVFKLDGLLSSLLLSLLFMLVTVVTITMLSLAYREISDRHPEL